MKTTKFAVIILLAALLAPACGPASPVSTPTATLLVEPMPTATLWDVSGKAEWYQTVVIATRGEYTKFLLIHPEDGQRRTYQLDGHLYNPLWAYQITSDCNLAALVNTPDGHKLILIDQNGVVIRELFFLKREASNTTRYLPVLSPDGLFVSYVTLSGELYYEGAQFQDLEVVKIDRPDLPVRLTSHGGAWMYGGVWSPNGDRLTYTDYDENGILQVYLTEISIMNRQVMTQFQNAEFLPGPISWSPRGDKIALILEDKSENRKVWIIPTDSGQAYKLGLPDDIVTIADKFFWSEDGRLLLLHVGDYTSSDLAGLYWFDVDKNQLAYALTEKAASQLNSEAVAFIYPFPLTTDLSIVAFQSSGYEWYSYNAISNAVNKIPWLVSEQLGIHLDISVFREDIFSCEK